MTFVFYCFFLTDINLRYIQLLLGMKYGAIAAFGVILILIVTVSFISPHPVFAGGYEKESGHIAN